MGSFLSGFLMAILAGTGYGFYLGYLGLDAYILAAIGSIMRIPDACQRAFKSPQSPLTCLKKHLFEMPSKSFRKAFKFLLKAFKWL